MKLSLVFATTVAVLGLQSVHGAFLRSSVASSSVDDVAGDAAMESPDTATTMDEIFDHTVVFVDQNPEDPEDPPELVYNDIQITIDNLEYVPDEHGRYLEAIVSCFKAASATILSSWSLEEFTPYKEIDVPVDDGEYLDEDNEGGNANALGMALEPGQRHNAILYAHAFSRKTARGKSDGRCHFCGRIRGDDDFYRDFRKRYPLATTFLQIQGMPDAIRREYEDTFCARLRMTGLKTFHGVAGCRFAYIYKPEAALDVIMPKMYEDDDGLASNVVEELIG